MTAHIPERMCAACRKRFPKAELTRFVKEDGKAVKDPRQKVNARGAYLCGSEECLKKAKKTRAMERMLKCTACDYE